MKIAQDARDFAAAQDHDKKEALEKGKKTKAVEFVKTGGGLSDGLITRTLTYRITLSNVKFSTEYIA